MLIDQFDSFFGLIRTLRKVEEGVDTNAFMDEVFGQNGSINLGKPSRVWPHRETMRVSLRINDPVFSKDSGFVGNVTHTVDSPNFTHFPKIRQWAHDFAREKNARLERVIIAALAPQKQVYRHADRGYYYAPRDRYHLVIYSEGGTMRIAGQEGLMKQGEVWWVNNKASHESFNNTESVRVHLIFDLYPRRFARRAYNYVIWLYLGLRPKRLTNYYFNWPKRFQATS